jgi:hypothetical protein
VTRATADRPSGTASPPNGIASSGRASIAARTLRKDAWWRAPLATFVLLCIWIAYATVRVFSQHYFFVEKYHYLSPFTSPCITASCPSEARDFGTWFGTFPPFLPLAIISLAFLGGFRVTCYYYRKAYYRSFYLSPPACAVAEPHGKYTGETRFPLLMQNAHRYFWAIAVLISLVNTYDVIRAFRGGDGGVGLGLGTLIMLANVVLLWCYTLGCHSCRHITGGRLRHFSKHPLRYRAWTGVSWLNARHMQFAWITLTSLLVTDLYIALVSGGAFADPRIFN